MPWPSNDYLLTNCAGIELAVFSADDDVQQPVCFVVHGRGSSMHKKFGYCRELRGAGITAIAIDQRNHGRRLVDASMREDKSPVIVAELFAETIGTARDIQLLIDTLPAIFGISPSRWGVTGTSLGGIASIVTMSLEDRIAACASLLGTGAMRELFEARMQEAEMGPDVIESVFTGGTEQLYRAYDPINHPHRFQGRPLLLTAGEIDEQIPIHTVRRFMQQLQQELPPGQPHTLSEYPETDHTATDEMRADAVTWLAQQLGARSAK